MSRIGRKHIAVPAGVEVTINGGTVTVKGPKGTLTETFHSGISIKNEGGFIVVERPNDDKEYRALHVHSSPTWLKVLQTVSQKLLRS